MTDKPAQVLLPTIDWLGLSLRLTTDVKPIDGHVWKEYTATNVWGKRRVLWTEHGDRVCTLLSEPRSRLLSPSAALLEIENEWFYHGITIQSILGMLLRSFFFEILGISRVDLAVDFTPTDEQAAVIESLANGDMYVGGKRNGSTFWSTNTSERLATYWRGRKIPHQQSWGHKTSAIKWKLYYKTKELWDAGAGKFVTKPYIVDQWRDGGLTLNNVWRLEVSMHHLNDYRLYGQHIDLNTIENEGGALFVDLYNTRFQVRKNEGHKDRTNDTIVPFLPITQVKGLLTPKPPNRLAEHNGRITLLRHLVASLDDEQVLLDEPTRIGVFEHIYSIVDRDGLGAYFRAITGKWVDEWIGDVDGEARRLFEEQYKGGGHLLRETKGKYAGMELRDVPRGNARMSTPNNTLFETYDQDGNVNPTDYGKEKAKKAPPRFKHGENGDVYRCE